MTVGCLHPWRSEQEIRSPSVKVIPDRLLPPHCQACRFEEEKGIPTECAGDDVSAAVDRLAGYCYSVQNHGEATCSLWVHQNEMVQGVQV